MKTLTKPNLIKPKIGGDPDIWGNKLNDNIDKQNAFYTKVVEDSSMKDEELNRLEQEKISKNQLDTFIANKVDNYIVEYGKPVIDDHVENVSKPDIANYVSGKKSEISQYVENTSKPEINSHVEKKKAELNEYNVIKKSELDEHEKIKEGQLDDYNVIKKSELDEHEKKKEKELNDFTDVKKTEITSHTNNEIENITNYTESKKEEINSFTDAEKVELDKHEKVKESELNSHTSVKKTELDEYNVVKKSELDEHTVVKEGQLDKYEKSKEAEINSHVIIKKAELDAYEKTKETELNEYTITKKTEITSHTNVEKTNITSHTNSKKTEISEYTESKKLELNSHEKEKEKELDSYTISKEEQLTNHTDSKKLDLNTHTEEKKVELNNFTNAEKLELNSYEKEKEKEISIFVDEKKSEITSHTDAEIERITSQGMDGKVDKNVYESDKTILENNINNKISKNGDTMTGLLKIENMSPIIEFNDKRVSDYRGGYIGCGTLEGTFQIVNRVTGKSLNLSSDGSLIYDKVNVYTENFKPTKSDVGLENVDNTSDNVKNVLSATKLTIARTINGVSFDGTSDIIIKADANEHNHNDLYYTKSETNDLLVVKADKSYVDTKVADLVDSAPEALDTLKELSTALGNDPNFATTVTNNLASKLPHGGYNGTGQQLKNDIDNKVSLYFSAPFLGLHRAGDNLFWYKDTSNYAMFWDASNFDPNSKVSKNGDNINGVLKIEQPNATGLILSRTYAKTANNNIEFRYSDASYYLGFINGILKLGSSVDLTSGYAIYHDGNKPSKEDVGLGNLQNWGVSSDINANSSQQYATTSSVYNTRTLISGTAKDFTVGGDANTYYPVQINLNGSSPMFWNFSISRGYNWTAPDTWNTPTHKGGLALSMQWSGDGAWGGNDHSLRVVQFSEQWTTMVARLELLKVGVVVWLRGGGAQYKLSSETGINATVTTHIGNLTDSDGAVFSPLSEANTYKHTINNRFPVRYDGGLFVNNNPVYHAGNKPTASDLGAMVDGGTYGTATFNNWVRAGGNSGLYFQSYGGGWHMTDSTWIRSYNSKPIHVSGADITCTNNIVAYYSDVRLKKNFKPVNNALKTIMSVNPYYYEQNDFAKELGYNEEGKIQIGFKAQEMEKILPQVIQEAPVNHRNDLSEETRNKIGDEPIKTIDYARITPLLWKAVQELTDKVTKLELELLKLNGGK